jgi:hypothetical protein
MIIIFNKFGEYITIKNNVKNSSLVFYNNLEQPPYSAILNIWEPVPAPESISRNSIQFLEGEGEGNVSLRVAIPELDGIRYRN